MKQPLDKDFGLKASWILWAFSFFMSFPAVSQSSPEVYGVYSLFPQGTARTMALGGAGTALSGDAAGLIYNPAGLAFLSAFADLSGTFNRVTNREAKTDFRDDVSGSYDYFQYALAFRFGPFAIAAGVSQPFTTLIDDNFGQKSEISVSSTDMALAYSLGKYFSLGVSYHLEKLKHTFAFNNSVTVIPETSVEANVSYLRAGAFFRSKKGAIGISWSQSREYDLDESADDTFSTYQPFRDAISPEKFSVGISLRIHKKGLVVFDIDKFSQVENAIYTASGERGIGTGIPITSKQQTILHGGLEYEAIKNKNTEVYMRVGAYEEPARLDGAKNRLHYTLGLEARFGPAVLSVSFDQAKNFNNTSQGFSLAIGSL